MVYRRFEYDSDTYRDFLVLRDVILRQPLGLTELKECFEAEADARFFGGFDADGRLVAGCFIQCDDDGVGHLKRMAVAEAFQGQHVGQGLLDAVEAGLKADGDIHTVCLEARAHAAGFYAKSGYQATGETFLLQFPGTTVTMPHVPMAKRIQ